MKRVGLRRGWLLGLLVPVLGMAALVGGGLLVGVPQALAAPGTPVTAADTPGVSQNTELVIGSIGIVVLAIILLIVVLIPRFSARRRQHDD